MNNLKSIYNQSVSEKLRTHFHYQNKHQIPKIKKIQISIGLGLLAQNKNSLQKAIEELRTISGQHPILTKAKKSIAGFKIRDGMPLGLVVTLRREKMYAFLEKLIKLVFPRIRDFRGVSPKSFDEFGNYSLGIADQNVFPEINFDSIEQRRGYTITIVIENSSSTEESYFLLKELGFPFSENLSLKRHNKKN